MRIPVVPRAFTKKKDAGTASNCSVVDLLQAKNIDIEPHRPNDRRRDNFHVETGRTKPCTNGGIVLRQLRDAVLDREAATAHREAGETCRRRSGQIAERDVHFQNRPTDEQSVLS